MRSRDWGIMRVPDEVARKLDDAVKLVDFPAKPAYFRSSVSIAASTYLLFLITSYFILE